MDAELIEWDYINETVPCCPVCGGEWPDAPTVYINEELGVCLFNGVVFGVSDSQARVIQVLRSSITRWVGSEELNTLAYSDLPDADVPTELSIVESAVRSLRRRLNPTGFVIEARRNFGYRLTQRKQGGRQKLQHEAVYRPRRKRK